MHIIRATNSLAAKCRDLEETLELMRSEFENMEDYWQVGGRVLALALRAVCYFVFSRKLRK